MVRRRRARPGDILQIPLEADFFGYCKVLEYGEIAFLDVRSGEEPPPLAELAGAATLFRVTVMDYALKTTSTWKVIGHAELSESEARASKFFRKDAISGKLYIYQSGEEYPDRYIEYPATYEECVGLERAAVWDPEHVESRLRDHFAGRENVWEKQMRITAPD